MTDPLTMVPLTPSDLNEIRSLVEAGDITAARYLARLVLTVEALSAQLDAAHTVIRRLLIDHVDPRTHPLASDWSPKEAAEIRAATANLTPDPEDRQPCGTCGDTGVIPATGRGSDGPEPCPACTPPRIGSEGGQP